MKDTPTMCWSTPPAQTIPPVLLHHLTLGGVGEFELHDAAESMLDYMRARHPDCNDDALAAYAIADSF